jgi:hypothetical protein
MLELEGMELYVLPDELNHLASKVDRIRNQYLALADGYRQIHVYEDVEIDDIGLLHSFMRQVEHDMSDQIDALGKSKTHLLWSESVYREQERALTNRQAALRNMLFTEANGTGSYLPSRDFVLGGYPKIPIYTLGASGGLSILDKLAASPLIFSHVGARLPSSSFPSSNPIFDGWSWDRIRDLYTSGYLSAALLAAILLYPFFWFAHFWGQSAYPANAGDISGGSGGLDYGYIGDHYRRVSHDGIHSAMRDRYRPGSSVWDGSGVYMGVGSCTPLIWYYVSGIANLDPERIRRRRKRGEEPDSANEPEEEALFDPKFPEDSPEEEPVSEDEPPAEPVSEDEPPAEPVSEDEPPVEPASEDEPPAESASEDEPPSEPGAEPEKTSFEFDTDTGSDAEEGQPELQTRSGDAPLGAEEDAAPLFDEQPAPSYEEGRAESAVDDLSERFQESQLDPREDWLSDGSRSGPQETPFETGEDLSSPFAEVVEEISDQDFESSLNIPRPTAETPPSGEPYFQDSVDFGQSSQPSQGFSENLPHSPGAGGSLGGTPISPAKPSDAGSPMPDLSGNAGKARIFDDFSPSAPSYRENVLKTAPNIGGASNFRQTRLSSYSYSGNVSNDTGPSFIVPQTGKGHASEGAMLAASALGVSPLAAAGAVHGGAGAAQAGGGLEGAADAADALGGLSSSGLPSLPYFLDHNLTAILGNVKRQHVSWMSSLRPLFLEVT